MSENKFNGVPEMSEDNAYVVFTVTTEELGDKINHYANRGYILIHLFKIGFLGSDSRISYTAVMQKEEIIK